MLLIAGVLGVSACSTDAGSEPDPAAEWRKVLALKPDAGADAEARQRYADALHRFMAAHPNHRRAREVWDTLELEHARELAASGAPEAAIERLERMIKRRAATTAEAGELLRTLLEQQHVTTDELELLQLRMPAAQVTERIGAPPRGWKRRTGAYESWFYRHADGGTAAVHFRNGRLIAVEQPARTPRDDQE